MIRKVKNKRLWKVYSENTGRVMGMYNSKEKAKKRLRQVEYWKGRNK